MSRTVADYRFRIWNPQDKCFDRFTFASFGDLIDWDHSQKCTDNENGYVNIVERDLEGLVLEQWTGLFDKNGVEIFEGDIMQDQSGNKMRVEWISDKDGFDWTGFRGIGYKVIGNIHENSELLNLT